MELTDTAFREIVDNVNDGVYVVDRTRRIHYWNASAERLSGFSRKDAIGKRCRDNMLAHVDGQGQVLCQVGCPLAATMRDGMPREQRVWMRHKDGHRQPVWVRSSPIRDPSGSIVGCVEFFSDDSVVRQARERVAELEPLAMNDPLTGLGNRRYLDEQVARCVREHAEKDSSFGLLLVDIDRFKDVNDNYGHDVGDTALTLVARTLSYGLGAKDTIARYGGEEFVVLQSDSTVDTLMTLAERLRLLVGESRLVAARRTIPLSVSLGGTVASPGDTLETLIPRADSQLYQAKETGRNRSLVDVY
jgi:diguanylate cyclase (GGDEF)-like protein/PAS domain S-box-containing protein